MGKSSEYIKQRDKELRVKVRELIGTLPIYAKDFLNEKAEQNPNTARAYARDLQTFFQYLLDYSPDLKGLPVKDIPMEVLEQLSFQDINEYQNYLDINHPEVSGEVSLENSKKAIARKMSSVRGLYHFLVAHDFIRNDPTTGAIKQKFKNDDHVITRLTIEEVREYLRIIYETDIGSDFQRKKLEHTRLRDYALLYLLLHTGIRVSECVALDLKDLNFRENSLIVVRKGQKEQRLYYNDDVQLALLDYIENERPNYATDDEPALFLSIQRRRMGARAIQNMVKKYAEEIGTNKHITPHKMRSTYGTALYNETGDIRLVADVLGHANVNTTVKHYAAIEEEHRKKAAMIKPYDNVKISKKKFFEK